MSVQQQIDRISSEVADQTTLLDQALALIEGKAAGGSVETCTVTLLDNSFNLDVAFDVYYVDQNGHQMFHVDAGGYEIVEVLTNSIVVISSEAASVGTVDSAELIALLDGVTLVYVSGNCEIAVESA